MNTPHDHHIKRIQARKEHKAYGMGLGIMLLDDIYPGFPGDVRNPSAYPFPIQYEVVEGVDIQQLVYAEDKSPCLDPLKRAAVKLESLGCRAIVAECGYFSYFQREIADAVNIPVFLSSLLQVPLAQQIIGQQDVVGILLSSKSAILDNHLESAGIKLRSNYVLAGVMDDGRCPEFDHIWTEGLRTDPPAINYEKAEQEFLDVAVEFYRSHPNMAAMVLECTGFPPFARSLQRQIDIPIFSWGTLLDYAFNIVVHRDYYGHV
jgi:hypothetical protein